MSKKHHNKDKEQQKPAMAAVLPELPPKAAEEEQQEVVPAVEAPAPVEEKAVEEETVAVEAPVVEAPAAEPAPQPKAEEPKEVPGTIAVPKEKIMSETIVNAGRAFHSRRGAPVKHTPAGVHLIELFDEYAELMKDRDMSDDKVRVRADKLVEVFNAACPTLNTDLQTATDLARIAFDRVMDGWGTIFSSTSIFAGDYISKNAQKSPASTDRLDVYFTAIIQLVEGIVEKSRVMFDADRLNLLIKNNGVATALTRLRDGVNARNGYTNLHK